MFLPVRGKPADFRARRSGPTSRLTARWPEWARRIRERHTRVARRSSPGMVLRRFQPAPGLRIHGTQTLLTLRTVANIQVNAIPGPRPGFRQILTREMLVRQPAANEPASRGPAMAPFAAPPARPSPVQLTRLESLSQHFHAPVTLVSRFAPRTAVTQPPAIGSIASRALRQFRYIEEFVRTFRGTVRMVAEPERAARRVLQQNRRHEDARPSAAMVLLPPRAAEPGAPPRQEPEEPRRTRPASPANPAPPAIDMDAITSHVMDQIDRRVVAWRERMGRF